LAQQVTLQKRGMRVNVLMNFLCFNISILFEICKKFVRVINMCHWQTHNVCMNEWMNEQTNNRMYVYEGLLESSQTVIVVTASEKEDEWRGQGHTSTSLLHQSAMWHHAVNMHCFHTSAFLTSCFVLSAIDGKIEQRVCIKFCMIPKPLKCFMRLLENILEAE
jgi:hypothetical protein